MAGISTYLVILAVILDFLVALSIPFFSILSLFIVGVDFTSTTPLGNTLPGINSTQRNLTQTQSIFGNNSIAFNGQLNSVVVQNVTQLQLGLWTACFTQSQTGNTNDTCLPASFGYTVTLTDIRTNTTFNLVRPTSTDGLFIEALAGGVTLVAVFTEKYAKHYYVLGAAILLHIISGALDFAFFLSVSKITPLLNQAKAELGAGFFLTIVSFLTLSVAAFTLYIEKASP